MHSSYGYFSHLLFCFLLDEGFHDFEDGLDVPGLVNEVNARKPSRETVLQEEVKGVDEC